MKLEQLQLQTNNLKNTARFYQEILELSIIENSSESISIQAGNSILKFIENKNFNSIYHFAFNIPNNKLEEAIIWVKNKIDLLVIEDKNVIARFENWNANAVYFYDNNGNLLEFIARNDLDNNQSTSFDSKSILNISEIGIVNETPLELANQLIEKHELEFFAKNPNSELFSAVGNDEGLLIIVQPNRNWYPTQIPAESNKTTIQIENNGTLIELNF